MSVDYKSAIIYGYDFSNVDFPDTFLEACEEAGFDVIYDGYDGQFCYIGICLSKCDVFTEVRFNIFDKFSNAITSLIDTYQRAPKGLLEWFPKSEVEGKIPDPDLYHICYAV